ncbi:MAG: efflux RND transporter periplasmic adaptor subunit [Alphaproteobacteria bacterium]|nr:efflux RND transporter periplasmic adaptor subunit [Alphaproteobacteria bacterium]MBV9692431.1 efflux RND transporter periplasmic adaptor subunit [Alphaproteobacteria bacterium]
MLRLLRAVSSILERVYERIMPGFWLRLKPGYQWAGAILLVVAAWIGSGLIVHPTSPVAENSDAKSVDTVPLVRVAELTTSERNATITVRGRTQALHAVDVRAEVEGTVKAIHFDKGQKVSQGDVLCEIDINDRGAKVAQMNAMVAQTGKELEVAQELFKEGFRSKTQLAQAEAAYEAAKAGAATMGIQLAKTKIRAPWNGYVDDRYVDVGDYVRQGDKCEMVIAPEPFLAVGAVSEHDVGQIAIGDPATAVLVTGETVAGKVSFVADRADTVTRTFRVEVTLPNADNKLRDGVSADINIPVKRVAAMKISPGILVLDDRGVVGVRTVSGGIVHFLPVRPVSETPDGMWIAGVPDHTRVITVGQQFVTEGERVKAVMDKGGAAG